MAGLNAAEARLRWEKGDRDPAFLRAAGVAFYQARELGLAREALALAQRAAPSEAMLLNQLGVVEMQLGLLADAEKHLRAAAGLDAGNCYVLNNLALVGIRQGVDGDEPRRLLEHVVKHQPGWLEPRLDLARQYLLQKHFGPLPGLLDQTTLMFPQAWQALELKAVWLEETNRAREAVAFYAQALAAAPDDATRAALLLKPIIYGCFYDEHARLLPQISAALAAGQGPASPYLALLVEDDPAIMLTLARKAHAELTAGAAVLPPLAARRGGKIRVGFLSDDLRNHPVGALMVEMFELVDRSRFEWVVFNHGADDGSDPRVRTQAAAHAWHEVGALDDAQTAELIRREGMDILVDLKGYTRDSRPRVFASRPAPVQASFLGYPATMGGPGWDYILADSAIIPPELERFYSEKVVRLPHSFQPNDRKRPLGTPRTRAEYGLPEGAFVLVSFNQPMKFSPPVLEAWLEILRRVPHAVLWLREYNMFPAAAEHLREFARRRGVDASRIIFAGHAPSQADHLARYAVADLALDTYPYNSHTTCSDALWGGCPLLSMPGRGYASRVAAGLLRVLGLPQLVVKSWDEYVAEAVRLAGAPGEIVAYRAHLVAARATNPLFDTPRYMRNFERALEAMHARAQAGLPPANIEVIEPAGVAEAA